MTEEEIIAIGEFCANISVSEHFNTLVAAYEKQTVAAMLSTKPSEEKAREKIYATLQGVRDFIGFMQEFVVERRKLLNPQPVDQTDDPSVHNIHDF